MNTSVYSVFVVTGNEGSHIVIGTMEIQRKEPSRIAVESLVENFRFLDMALNKISRAQNDVMSYHFMKSTLRHIPLDTLETLQLKHKKSKLVLSKNSLLRSTHFLYLRYVNGVYEKHKDLGSSESSPILPVRIIMIRYIRTLSP